MRLSDGISDSMDMSLSKLWKFHEAQGSLACYSPWGLKESDMTKQLNSNVHSGIFQNIFHKTDKTSKEIVVMTGNLHRKMNNLDLIDIDRILRVTTKECTFLSTIYVCSKFGSVFVQQCKLLEIS